jgi:hypothetical protein
MIFVIHLGLGAMDNSHSSRIILALISGESISGITACTSLRLLGKRVDIDDEKPEKETNP